MLATNIPGKTKTEKFRFMTNLGYAPDTIKRDLKISQKNYENYLRELEESTTAYLNHLAKTGHISTMASTLQSMARDIMIQEGIRDLAVKHLEKDPSNLKRHYATTHANACLSKMRTELFDLQGKTPLAAAFKAFIRKNIVEKTNSKDHSNNKYGMPVLPEQLEN